jgi:hypothetical protein
MRFLWPLASRIVNGRTASARLLSLFSTLVTLSSGDVEEAAVAETTGRKYGLFDEEMSIARQLRG